MMKGIFYHEKLNFLFRGSALTGLLLLGFALVYAGWSGDRWRDSQSGYLQNYEAGELQSLAEYRTQLAAIESGEIEAGTYDANPMSIAFPAVLPPASLADFAVGHADLHPSSALISPWRNLTSTFGRYQFDNPTTLSASAFDIALVVIVLMPILMIAISFDVVASERSRSLLAMVLASPVSLSRLVWTRLAIRNGLLWAIAMGLMVVLAVMNNDGGDRFERLGIWLAICICYGLVWFSLIALCIAHFRTAVATAGALVGMWLLFTLALPATVATLADAVYPTPSRLAMLSEIREAQGETNRRLSELTEGFLMDHPDLTVGDDELPAYFRAAFMSNQAAREATQPIVEAYAEARDGREKTARWAQYLSPSIVAQRILVQVAGADLQRQHAFQAQVIEELGQLADVVGPAVVSRNRVSLATFDQLEPFKFRDASARQIASQAAWPGLFLIILSLVLGFAAQRKFTEEEVCL